MSPTVVTVLVVAVLIGFFFLVMVTVQIIKAAILLSTLIGREEQLGG